jgi:medium-chain acyl-[acyl-carrier-protein] hydrolase
LICFPYAGAPATAFRAWADALSSEVEVCAVQLPGRPGRSGEQPLTRFAQALQGCVRALARSTDLPYGVFGHSLGALLGFEFVRHMRSSGRQGPLHLFVSGQDAPPVLKPPPCLSLLPEPELLEELRRLGGTPEAVLQEPELLRLLLPVVRADCAAYESYAYWDGEAFDCPVTAFGGLADHRTTREGLSAWRRHTNRTFTLRMFPGAHFFLHDAQRDLLRAISDELVPPSVSSG